MATVGSGSRYVEVEEDDWVAVPSSLKRKVDEEAGRRGSAPAKDDLVEDVLYHKLHKTATHTSTGIDALMQSQYFGVKKDDKVSREDKVSVVTMHPVAKTEMEVDPLDELFDEEGCGYLHDDEPSEPSPPLSPGLSLESSIIEELETSMNSADSANIAVAFASIARKSTEKGRPTIISMRLDPKSNAKQGGLAVTREQDAKKVYSRVSVVGPIDLADPDEVARLMSRNTQNAYVVTECHSGLDLEDFALLDESSQSDLLWDWSVFREDAPKKQKKSPRAQGVSDRKECLLGDLLQNSLLFPMTKKVFWERCMPILITTHVVSVLVGVVIGRRLSLPAQDRR